MTDRFNLRGDELKVAKSTSRAVNQFPEVWRTAPYSFNYLPMLNDTDRMDTQEAIEPAHLDMITKIK